MPRSKALFFLILKPPIITNIKTFLILSPNKKGIDDTVVLGGAALGATALTYYMTRKDPPIDPLYDFDNQSVEIDV